MTPKEFVQFTVNIRGKPIDLLTRPWLERPYNQAFQTYPDGDFRRKTLLIFGRQCEKSSTLANLLIACCNLIPYLRCLYVSASDAQMREFSDERLRAVIQDSEILKSYTKDVDGTQLVQNVLTKRWRNQSKIVLRSVYRSADRARGISADLLDVDELQDILTDALPVLEETMFASDLEGGPIALYAGTPKTFENPLEFYWSKHSTQAEWMVRCRRCRYWNTIELENVGKHCLICSKCSKEIDPLVDGRWVAHGAADAEWQGFRVPQPVVLHAHRHHSKTFERKWRDLLNKIARYPRGRLMNEVMARSYDNGVKPISREQVRRCSLPDVELVHPSQWTREMRSSLTYAGVDWGTGNQSYTLLSIWYYDQQGRFRLAYAKRYEGVESDPEFNVPDIIKTLQQANITRIGADWGFGFHANPKLVGAFGAARVATYMHSDNASEKVEWNKKALAFVTHRTRVLQDCFDILKRGPVSGGVALPRWEEAETFAQDILNVFTDESRRLKQSRFSHSPDEPDDFLQTMCTAFLVSQLDFPRPDLHRPSPGQKGFNE